MEEARFDHKGMWINDERVLYTGLLGRPGPRTFGAWAIYVSVGAPFVIQRGAEPPFAADAALVSPHVPHVISSPDNRICGLLVEYETIDPAGLQAAMGDWAADGSDLAMRFRRNLRRMDGAVLSTRELDSLFLGAPLPARSIDRRIGRVCEGIRRDPFGNATADGGATLAGLSQSRFLHLFKEQTGASFRRFKAWKRARSILGLVTGKADFTGIALDAGYADSSHFSHSIRQIYGLTPRAIFSGSRDLVLYARPDGPPQPGAGGPSP